MTKEEYFGKWLTVIDTAELDSIMHILSIMYKTKSICPAQRDVFKAFNRCPLDTLRVVFLGQDPYPQEGVATGIAFGNTVNTSENKLSPSLKVIKEAVINYDIPHNNSNFDFDNIIFDSTLESWCKQGVLMLNSALTVEQDMIGSHKGLWKRFIQQLLTNLSHNYTGIVYVLLGSQAQSFEQYIHVKNNHLIKVEHPAYFVRMHKKMPNIFNEINNILIGMNGDGIEWFQKKQEDTECYS